MHGERAIQSGSPGNGSHVAEATITNQSPATNEGALAQKYRLSEQVVIDRLGDSMVAVQLGTDKIFDLNETAARLVELLSDGRTAAEAATVIAGEYDATSEAVTQDVAATIATLVEESILEVAE